MVPRKEDGRMILCVFGPLNVGMGLYSCECVLAIFGGLLGHSFGEITFMPKTHVFQ